jgi:hypothetical protein
MALAMALACLANSNHSETSAVGAPSDPYDGPVAARWQSFVVTELADRRQRRTTVTRPNVRGPNVEVAPSIQHRFPAVRRAQRQKPTLGTHSASHDAIAANRAHPGCA